MTKKVCKRCGEYPRLDDPLRNGFGAISKVGKVMICSDCGIDEEYENFVNGSMTPISEWACNK